MDLKYNIHISVEASAIVIRKNGEVSEVLVVSRNIIKDTAFPKGKVEPGESLQAAAIRETMEETGWTIKIKKFVNTYEYTHRDEASKTDTIDIVFAFLAEPIEKTSGFLDKNEVKGVEWLSVEEAKAKLSYKNLLPLLEKAEKLIAE